MATLNADEISALMEAIEDGRLPDEPSTPRDTALAYDLTSRDRIIRGQMPTLDSLHEQVASVMGSGLSGRIRLAVRVTSSPSMLVKFSDVYAGISPATTLCVISLGKTQGLTLAMLDQGLAEMLLGAALGDRQLTKPVQTDQRKELTALERSVLKRLLSVFTDAISQSWGHITKLSPEVVRFESDPRMAAIAPATEPAIVTQFEFTGGITGSLQFAIPLAAVESEKKALFAPPKVVAGTDARFSSALIEELGQTKVELRTVLGRTQLDVSRLLELKIGDVLTLDTSEHSSLEVTIEGRPKLMGKPQVSGSNLALLVEQDLRAFSNPETKSHPRLARDSG